VLAAGRCSFRQARRRVSVPRCTLGSRFGSRAALPAKYGRDRSTPESRRPGRRPWIPSRRQQETSPPTAASPRLIARIGGKAGGLFCGPPRLKPHQQDPAKLDREQHHDGGAASLRPLQIQSIANSYTVSSDPPSELHSGVSVKPIRRWPCKASASMSPSLADFVAVQGYFSEVQEHVADSRPINRLSKI
jgi:hypothetical protein